MEERKKDKKGREGGEKGKKKKEENTHGCLSRRRTLAPRSRRVWAAERPARPPPTTITCAIVYEVEMDGMNGIGDGGLRRRRMGVD